MGLSFSYYFLISLLVLFPALCSSQDIFVSSKATYYGSPDCLGTPSGACGYGEFGKNINGGDVGAVSKLYRNGSGCGACYQIRCTLPQLCNENGVMIVVTDHGQSDESVDFILSVRGFTNLARANLAAELISYGMINIEYRRISCQYPGYNLMFRITEHSKFPDYLSIIVLYQAGQQDIVAVELWQENCQEWRGMRRAHGAVWDMVNPPRGAINLRFLASGADGQKWLQLTNVIPSDWKAGVAYDSAIQLA